MELIHAFQKIGKIDAHIAGGKGASLGEMTQAGIPVPPGFVILSTTFDQFIKETDLAAEIDTILHSVNREEMHTVEHASEKIQKLILAAKMPADIAQDVKRNFKELGAEFVAVRSSATAEDSSGAAWAGQLDTFLNTTEATLLENVQRCWASLFTSRAIFYRFEKNLHTQAISVAVVVQKMVASEVSGIAFSVHPVTEDRNQLIIEAGFGLGEAIVSGQVTPDSYVVEKTPRRIIDINVSTQTRALYRKEGGGNEWRDIAEPKASSQVLTEAQILELAELVIKIENHYGFPCDIEWAFEANKFYITQSRPITTLSQNIPSEDSEQALLSDIHKWKFWGRWRYNVFGNAPWNFYTESEAFKKLNMPQGFTGYAVNVDGYVYSFLKDNELFDAFAIEKFKSDRAWFDNFFDVAEQSIQGMLAVEHTDNIPAAMKGYANLSCLSMLIHFCDKALEKIVPELAEKSGIASEDFIKVLVPYKPTFLMEYASKLTHVADSDLDAFVRTYESIGVNYFNGKKLTKEDVLKERASRKPHEEPETLSLDTLSSELRSKIEILQKLIYYRSANVETFNRVLGSMWGPFDTLASKNGITRDDLNQLTHLEIAALANGGNLPSDFKKRTVENGITFVKGNFRLYFGDALRRYFRCLSNERKERHKKSPEA